MLQTEKMNPKVVEGLKPADIYNDVLHELVGMFYLFQDNFSCQSTTLFSSKYFIKGDIFHIGACCFVALSVISLSCYKIYTWTYCLAGFFRVHKGYVYVLL